VGVAEPPPTWSGWKAALARVAAAGGPERHALLLPLTEWEQPVVLALQHGAELLREGDRYGNFRSPAFRAAFDLYLSFFREGLAPAAGAARLANLPDFAAGLFAAFVSGPWQLGELRRRLPAAFEPRWATAPLPILEGAEKLLNSGLRPLSKHGVSIAGGAGLSLVRGSERKDAAWRLAAFLAEPAQQVAFYRLTGPPPRRSAWRTRRSATTRTRRLSRGSSTRARPKGARWERIASRIARHAGRVQAADAGRALAALDREADRLLEKRRFLLAERPQAARPSRQPARAGGGAR
jgi:multiple sugar transport system substrate-binding protein